ncbi:MAG TPA: ABC transporter permease [Actinomycetota bacterium]
MSTDGATGVERRSRWRRAMTAAGGALRRLGSKWKAFVFLALLILAWEGYTEWGHTQRFVLPPPTSVWSYLIHNPGLFWHHSLITLREVLTAFVISVSLGVVLAGLIERFKVVEETLLPLLVVTQVVPTIAIAPLLVLLLGFGSAPKIAVAVLISFFPIVINTFTGLRSVDEDLVLLSKGLGAGRLQYLWKIALPTALPYILAGARLAITLSIIGAVIGEFVVSNAGLGFLILQGSAQLTPEQMVAALVVLAIIGILLFNAVRLIEYFATPWAFDRQGRPRYE